MRATFENFSWNSDSRLTGIEARRLRPAARIFRDAARFRRIGLVPGGPPVNGPFPDIADHVVDAVAVRRERGYRRSALKTVPAKILVREIALPGIGEVPAAGGELIAPGIFGAIESAARSEFPFSSVGNSLPAHCA